MNTERELNNLISESRKCKQGNGKKQFVLDIRHVYEELKGEISSDWDERKSEPMRVAEQANARETADIMAKMKEERDKKYAMKEG